MGARIMINELNQIKAALEIAHKPLEEFVLGDGNDIDEKDGCRAEYAIKQALTLIDGLIAGQQLGNSEQLHNTQQLVGNADILELNQQGLEAAKQAYYNNMDGIHGCLEMEVLTKAIRAYLPYHQSNEHTKPAEPIQDKKTCIGSSQIIYQWGIDNGNHFTDEEINDLIKRLK